MHYFRQRRSDILIPCIKIAKLGSVVAWSLASCLLVVLADCRAAVSNIVWKGPAWLQFFNPTNLISCVSSVHLGLQIIKCGSCLIG